MLAAPNVSQLVLGGRSWTDCARASGRLTLPPTRGPQRAHCVSSAPPPSRRNHLPHLIGPSAGALAAFLRARCARTPRDPPAVTETHVTDSTHTTPTPTPVDPVLALAVQLLGGAAMCPSHIALAKVGWPGSSRQAICDRRRAGTMPCSEIRIGEQYYITAASIADAFLRRPAQGVHVPPPPRKSHRGAAQANRAPRHPRKSPGRRRPGRPRKSAGDAE